MIAEGEETRYVGDALVVLAATTRDAARRALDVIRVEYEELTPLLSPKAALAIDAPRIHPKGNLLSQTIMKRGDVDKAIAEAQHVVVNTVLDAAAGACISGAGERACGADRMGEMTGVHRRVRASMTTGRGLWRCWALRTTECA